jgi:hypothetical protein
MEPKKRPPSPKVRKTAKVLIDMNKGDIPSDVLGSYTGMTREDDRPEQDADDL